MANKNFQVKHGLEVGATVTADAATGNITTSGDVAVNGGDLTTNQTAFNLLNTTATTVNAFGAATTLELGAATGTTNINNNLEVDGDVTIDGGDLIVSTSTFNLANTTATTLNIGGGATTAVVIGNSAGEIDTPSDVQQTGNKSFRQGDGPYSGSTDILRDNNGNAIEGYLASNNNMTTADSALVVRTYGGTTPTSGVAYGNAGKLFMQGSRGTSASPLAINSGNGIGLISFSSNLGTTAGAGTGTGFTTDNSPVLFQPGAIYSFANQNHRQTLQATFTGSISGTTLTVTAVASGVITAGHEVRGTGFDPTNAGYTILYQSSSTAPSNALGSTGTYELWASPGTIASSTMTTVQVQAGSQMRFQQAHQFWPLNANTFQSLTFTTAQGGVLNAPYTSVRFRQSDPYLPQATRIIREITGGNTLNIGTHGFTVAGASFTIITAGNPNGLTTGTTYFIDTIPSTTTVTLRTVSSGGGAVTGLTNGSGLFILADAAAIAANGNQTQPSNVAVAGTRGGHNYAGSYNADNNRQNDWLGEYRFTGGFSDFSSNTNTKIFGRATQDWAAGSAAGSEIGFQSIKNSTLTTYISTIGANGSTFVNDSFTMNNTLAGSMLSVDSSGNLTINGDLRVNGNDLLNSNGTTVMTMTTGTPPNVIFAGDIRINGNDILASDGNTNISLTSNTLTAFAGDIRVNGNDIQNSTGTTAITMSTGTPPNVIFAGDIRINGSDINASDGNTNITLTSNTLTTFAGDVQINGNDILNSAGTTVMTMSTGTPPNVIFAGDIRINGNDIIASDGNTNISLTSNTLTTFAGDIRVNGGDIQNPGGTNAITLTSANATTTIRGDSIALKVNAGTAATSANVDYTRTFGEFAYTNAAGFAIAAQNTIYTMPLDTTLNNSGVTIANTGDININVSGWYKIIMSLQVTLTVSNQPGQIDFWLRKNGADVANSKTQVDLLKDQKSVISMDWLVNSDGNDYWEIVYVGTTTNYADIDFPTIAATTTPYVSPLAPALLVNVIPAGM